MVCSPSVIQSICEQARLSPLTNGYARFPAFTISTSNVFSPAAPTTVKLLAGLAYSENQPGIWFIDPPQWVMHHMFEEASVWDIPLIKPRFGCSASLALSLQGYDVAHELNRYVYTFRPKTLHGNCCKQPLLLFVVECVSRCQFAGPYRKPFNLTVQIKIGKPGCLICAQQL